MKKNIYLIWLIALFCAPNILFAKYESPTSLPVDGGKYTLVVEGFDWGAAVNKVIIAMDQSVKSVDGADFTVLAERKTDCMELPKHMASGSRSVIHAYVSDEKGSILSEGTHITLVLAVAPNMPISSPIQYIPNEKCRGNVWVDYTLTITQNSTNKVWDTETDRIIPLIDRFDLSGKFKFNDAITLPYASYTPQIGAGKRPLIIWLHGGGEGGADPSIPLIANRAANYASDDIQAIFGGAYVLSPQSPTYWMDNGKGGMTRGDVNDIYNEALMALFKDFITKNPNIDTDRVYVGGCSNGGYMTLKLLFEYPDFFAAAFPSALAYSSEFATDQQIESIKHVPIWFVHSKDDPVTVAKTSVVPMYDRLKKAGASNTYFSFYDHVVDITGFFGGDGYRYNGHFSWIYCHANVCRKDVDGSFVMVDGRSVTIMEWLAAQSK